MLSRQVSNTKEYPRNRNCIERASLCARTYPSTPILHEMWMSVAITQEKGMVPHYSGE